jgi:hypothetical protein
MYFSQWLDRFANTAGIAIMLASLPIAALGFLFH